MGRISDDDKLAAIKDYLRKQSWSGFDAADKQRQYEMLCPLALPDLIARCITAPEHPEEMLFLKTDKGYEFHPRGTIDWDVGRAKTWLGTAIERDQPWLSETDDQGIPLRLRTMTLKDSFAALSKEYEDEKDRKKVSSGLIRDELTVRRWGEFTDVSPDIFYRAMTAGLPAGTNLEVVLDKSGHLSRLEYSLETGKCAYEDFSFKRVFNHEHHTVWHGGASVAEKGKGIARAIHSILFPFYESLDIKTVGIRASEIGGYAWARSGFAPDMPEWFKNVRRQVGWRLDVIERLPDPPPAKIIYGLRRVLSEADGKGHWFVVDQTCPYAGTTLGRCLAMPTHHLPVKLQLAFREDERIRPWLEWNGDIHMKDPAFRERYSAYLDLDRKRPALQLPSVRL